ncbi:MAG: hypothetical protein JG718_01415 [Candidatus Thiothrix moscowensis]|nr:hypothetical protein [Candidatus Thiothrix moscowensis]
MQLQLKPEFEEILEPLGENAAAALANLNFNELLYRLREHFGVGFQVAGEMVLETAINGRADILVTFNLRDYGDAPARFGIQAMRPADAIRRIRI